MLTQDLILKLFSCWAATSDFHVSIWWKDTFFNVWSIVWALFQSINHVLTPSKPTKLYWLFCTLFLCDSSCIYCASRIRSWQTFDLYYHTSYSNRLPPFTVMKVETNHDLSSISYNCPRPPIKLTNPYSPMILAPCHYWTRQPTSLKLHPPTGRKRRKSSILKPRGRPSNHTSKIMSVV